MQIQYLVGKVTEESNDKLLGVLSYKDKEIYAISTPSVNSKVVFTIKKIGPNKKLERAIDVFSYNCLLDSLRWNKNIPKEKERLFELIMQLGYSNEDIPWKNKKIHIEVLEKIKKRRKMNFINEMKG